MKIDNAFVVGVPVERAWEALTDLEGLAPCLPGAQLTGIEGDVYQGKVKVKVGPVVSQFAGTAQFVESDPEARRAVVRAKGRDARGGGNASALIDMRLAPDGDGTAVTVATDLNITGKLAQFGSGMIKEISQKLLGQFVANLEEKLHAPAAEAPAQTAEPGAAPAGSGEAAGTAPAGTPETTPRPAPAGASAPDAAHTAGTTTTGTLTETSPERPEPRPEPAAAAAPPVERPTPPAPVPHEATAEEPPAVGAPEAAPEPAAAAPAASGTASTSSAPSTSSTPRTPAAAEEPEALDLMSLAGGSVYKRVIPAAVVVLIVIAVVVYFLVR
ncbi:SRPBCC domain-containing protein [Streptomyces sp. NPDC050560]|uniref:SRPBCC family protein n=1 Tax=Streptomyces sp. NPDC050560 TaxID=3365630 RepID=UPI0037B71CF3